MLNAPTDDASDVIKDAFWETLKDNIERVPKRKEITVMEDMNVRVERQDVSEVVRKFGERVLNDNGERLIGIC